MRYCNSEVVYPGLNRWMRKNDMSTRELSRKLDMCNQTVYRWLKGDVDIRKYGIDKILRLTGMTYEEAFGDPRKEG